MRCSVSSVWAVSLLVSLIAVARSDAAATLPVVDALARLPDGSTRVGGRLGEQIRACVEQRILKQNVQALVDPFTARADVTEWRGEFWGKWLTSAVAAYRVTPAPALRAKIERAVALLAATQTPDGYLGTYAPEHRLERWDVWSRKYTLLGLLAWHDVSHDAQALELARSIGDGLVRDAAAAGNGFFANDMWSGMATSSVIEPMVLLHRATGDPRYLEFCRWVISRWPEPGGPDLLRKARAGTPVFAMFPGPDATKEGYFGAGSSKAYEMMSCFEGLVELHRVTGDPAYAEAAKAVHRNIRETEITIVGSGSDWERWCGGHRRQAEPWQKGMETCVTVTWMKLSAQLLRLTGDPSYADDIERAAWNALLGAQAPDGTWWAHHSPLAGTKERAPEQCDMAQNCCVANGPRGVLLLPELAVLAGRDGPVVNLYGQMTTVLRLHGGRHLRLQQRSDYPESGDIRIEVTPDRAAEFTLSLRLPAWSRQVHVSVNGGGDAVVPGGRYHALHRTWQPGDVVTLSFDLSVAVQEAPGQPGFFALTRGPIVLARDARLGGNVDEPVGFDFARTGPLTFRRITQPTPAGVWLCFDVFDAQGRSLRFCDYASAGNTWSDESRFRVWSPSAPSVTTR